MTLWAALLLVVAGSLAYWGGSFAKNMVHDQLVEQRIFFGTKEALEKEGEDAHILKYAGQQVDTGAKAKAFSDYIGGHLKKVANGQTYSEVSAAYLKDTKNQTLAGQRQTLFMGEMLRGTLLNAYGWGLVGDIAVYASIALMTLGGALCLAYVYVSLPAKTSAKKPAKKSTRKK